MSTNTKPELPPEVRAFFSRNGKIGGKLSKRAITPEQQAALQAARLENNRLKRLAGLPTRRPKSTEGGVR